MNTNPQMKRFLKYAFFIMLVSTIVAAGVTFLIIWELMPETSNWVRIPLLIIMTHFISKWLNNLSVFFLTVIIYRGNYEQSIKDLENLQKTLDKKEQEPQNEEQNYNVQMQIEIVDRPDNPIGRFKDADIFEWLDVKDPSDGKRHRFVFDGTFDMSKVNQIEIPQNSFVVAPGIVYKMQESK